jgi:hypothetical protein
MSGRTHAQPIIALLSERSGLDNDEIARALSIDPRRHPVFGTCRIPLDHPPVVHPGLAFVGWQVRRNTRPLLVRQSKQVRGGMNCG